MNNTIFKWALMVAIAIATLFLFISVLPYLLFFAGTAAIVYLLYSLVEVNSGRKTPEQMKTLLVESVKDFFTFLKK